MFVSALYRNLAERFRRVCPIEKQPRPIARPLREYVVFTDALGDLLHIPAKCRHGMNVDAVWADALEERDPITGR